MTRTRHVYFAVWAIYALVVLTHLTAMLTGATGLTQVTQPMANPILAFAVLVAASRPCRTSVLTMLALACAWMGDLLPPFVPWLDERVIPTASFLGALLLFTAALVPLWMRNRDPLRYALVIPYGAVVVGLFLAFAKGAGPLLPLLAAYAVALAVMAFFASGVNALTWTGCTLFMLSNALLGMVWFLPGAWLPQASVAVMATYFLGQGLLVGGLVRMIRTRRWSAAEEREERLAPTSLVVIDG